MTKDKITSLLQDADRTAGGPSLVSVDPSAIRRRVRRKRLATAIAPFAAAAVVVGALGVWALANKLAETTQQQREIASLQNEIKVLQARTDATLKLIHEVLETERRQRRLEELQAQLASIPDPLEEVQKQVDKAAHTLVYQADRMHRQPGQTNSAAQAYSRVIELFPQSRWADVARQRLEEIEKSQSKKQIQKEI